LRIHTFRNVFKYGAAFVWGRAGVKFPGLQFKVFGWNKGLGLASGFKNIWRFKTCLGENSQRRPYIGPESRAVERVQSKAVYRAREAWP
jgi:hypothetical protein